MSLIAATSLLFPGSVLESMWQLNPRARGNLGRLGLCAVVLLYTVSVFCAAAAVGLWQGSQWGHKLAIVLMVINLLGDLTNVVLGTEPRAIIGVPIASAILGYLVLNKRVRAFFSQSKN